ncbi:MAG: RNA ligase family protein [Myxococcota bacterium]
MSPTLRKYPRTPHLPWSPGGGGDDVRLGHTPFDGRAVVVTEKMDGENTTLYRDACHARSVDGGSHPSRAWVRALQGRVGWQIPPGFRVCGENLYARHSIGYEQLPSYFLVFSVWDGDTCLAWDETRAWCAERGLHTVPEWWSGAWDERRVRALAPEANVAEGYVVRLAERFTFDAFDRSVAKWVRPDHVQTDAHWMRQVVVPNRLRGGS